MAPGWGDGVNPKATASEGGIGRLGGAGRRAELGPGHPRKREAKAVSRTCRREGGQARVGGGPRPRKVLHQPAHVRPEGQEARAAREAVPQSGLSLGRPRPALRAPPLVRAAARAPEPSGAAQGRVEPSSRRVASPV